MSHRKPLAIDLYSGLGGWAEGLLAEGWDVVGFDIERHSYPARDLMSGARKVHQNGVDFNNPREGSSVNRSFNFANEVAFRDAPATGGWMAYPGQLVLQDVLTLHGSQFRDADLIVASPPCQEYSYMAMPWTRAKAKAAAIRADTSGKMLADLNRLFDACFRIQAQASLAAGRHIPMVVENVRGAQPWVGRARWNFGSFYLWGDVPALMPFTKSVKNPDLNWSAHADHDYRTSGKGGCFRDSAIKNTGGSWFAVAHNTTSGKGQNPDGRKIKPPYQEWRDGAPHTSHLTNPAEHGIKHHGSVEVWFDTGLAALPSSSPRRKAASAMIAKIPTPLAAHIAAVYRPNTCK